MIRKKIQANKYYRQYPAVGFIVKWTIISLVIALLTGSASAIFLISLEWVGKVRENNHWIMVFLPIAGLLIGYSYQKWGQGIETGNNLLIERAAHPQGERIPLRMAPMVLLGTLATHLFGGSAGREGTALQMAGAISDQFSKPFKLNQNDRKILIMAAIGAGFGSVFGTPLAGAIFALEVVVIGKIKYDAIFPVFMASILANLVTHLWPVHHVHYLINMVPTINFLHVLYAIVAGIIFGLTAALFSKMNTYFSAFFRSHIKQPVLRPFVGGIIVVALIWLSGPSRYAGLGIPIIESAFSETVLPWDFLFKMILTALTLSAGFKGGEVTPLFFIGATLGNALSAIIPLPMSLMAGMGFVAVFAGATNTPLACSIMAIELFGAECGAYVAIACVVAYLTSGNNSIYNGQFIGQAKHVYYGKYAGKRIKEMP